MGASLEDCGLQQNRVVRIVIHVQNRRWQRRIGAWAALIFGKLSGEERGSFQDVCAIFFVHTRQAAACCASPGGDDVRQLAANDTNATASSLAVKMKILKKRFSFSVASNRP